MIQPQSEKYVIQFFRRDPRQLDLVCQRQHSLLHSVIGGLLGLVHFLIVIWFHGSFLFYCFHLSYFYILTEGFSFGWMFLIFLKKFISYATFLKTVQSNHQRPVKNGFITKGVLL